MSNEILTDYNSARQYEISLLDDRNTTSHSSASFSSEVQDINRILSPQGSDMRIYQVSAPTGETAYEFLKLNSHQPIDGNVIIPPNEKTGTPAQLFFSQITPSELKSGVPIREQ